MSPRRAKAVPKVAEAAATRRSQKSVMRHPRPAAGPLTAAMIGLGIAISHEDFFLKSGGASGG